MVEGSCHLLKSTGDFFPRRANVNSQKSEKDPTKYCFSRLQGFVFHLSCKVHQFLYFLIHSSGRSAPYLLGSSLLTQKSPSFQSSSCVCSIFSIKFSPGLSVTLWLPRERQHACHFNPGASAASGKGNQKKKKKYSSQPLRECHGDKHKCIRSCNTTVTSSPSRRPALRHTLQPQK